MMTFSHRILVAAVLLACPLAHAQPTQLAAPAAIHTSITEPSAVFALRINGQPVDVHHMSAFRVSGGWGHMHYAHFSMRGVLDVEVDLLGGAAFNWIRPRAFGVEPAQAGDTVSFKLYFPHYYIFEANAGGEDHALVLFADGIPANAPQPGDPNVLSSGAAGILPGADSAANRAAYDAAVRRIQQDPSLDILYIEPGHFDFTPEMRTGVGVWVAGGAYIDSGPILCDWQEGFYLRGRGAIGGKATYDSEGNVRLGYSSIRGQFLLLRQARNFLLDGLLSRYSGDWNTALRLVDDVMLRDWKVLNVLDWVNNDGIDTERARRVSVHKSFVSAGADAVSDKANGKSITLAYGFERDVRDIDRFDGVFYAQAHAQKFGTESDADYMEGFHFEDMFVVRATGGPRALLADRATMRDLTMRNWHIDNGSPVIDYSIAPWGGRDPTTANIREVRMENIFSYNSTEVRFSTFNQNTPITDVSLSNIWRSSSFATDTSGFSLGTYASDISVAVEPSVWAAHDRYGIVGEPVPLNGYFIDAAGNWSTAAGPGSYAVTWSVVSGPGSATFASEKDPRTSVVFDQRGEYRLRLAADGLPDLFDELTVTVLDPAFAGAPSARFVASPTMAQAGLPVTFDAGYSEDPDGEIVSYEWDFGDGTTLTSPNPVAVHNYASAGIHKVELRVIDDSANTRRVSDYLVVRERERVPFGGTAHAVPGRIQAEDFDSGAPGIAFADRSGGDLSPGAYRPVPEFIEEYFATRFPDIRPTSDPDDPGGHELHSLNTPSGSSLQEFVSYTLDVTQTGFYDLRLRVNSDAPSVDRKFNVYLNGEKVVSERNWGRSSTYITTTVPDMYFGETGEQVLKIEWLGDFGEAGGLNYFDLVRTGAPVPTANFGISPEFGIAPLEITVDASASSGNGEAIIRYDWNFGDGTVITGGGASVSHTYTADGEYVITLTVANVSGNTDTTSRACFVGNRPPVAEFTYNPEFPEIAGTVAFDAAGSFDEDGVIVRYDWDFGDATLLPDGGAAPQHAYPAQGRYTVTLTVEDDHGDTGVATRDLYVGNRPPAAVLVASPTVGLEPLTVGFDAGGSHDPDGVIVRYDWDFGDGSLLGDGGAAPNHTYVAAGNYTATVTVVDDDGAAGTASVPVSVFPPGEAIAVYHFDFDANGGAGSTVDDVSGVGDPAHASSFLWDDPADLFSTTTPGSGFGGDFTAARSNMVFSAAKWNTLVAGGSNAFTFVWAMRLLGFGSSGDNRDRAFFEDTSGNFRIGGTTGDTGESLRIRADIGAVSAGAASLDAGSDQIVAVTWSADDPVLRVYRGTDYGSLALHDAVALAAGGAPAMGSIRVGDTSARDPDMYIDDIRVYDSALSLAELMSIGQAGEPDAYQEWADLNNITGGPDDSTGGIANLIRYAYGGTASTSIGELLPRMTAAGEGTGLTFTVRLSRIDDPLVRYAVWISPDLADWGSEPAWAESGTGPETIELHVPDSDKAFLKFEVTRD